jgi:hypothetical protein
MICLAITGAKKSTPTAAMEVLLNLTPLDLMIMAEAKLVLYRLHTPKQSADYKTEAGMLSIGKKVGSHIKYEIRPHLPDLLLLQNL